VAENDEIADGDRPGRDSEAAAAGAGLEAAPVAGVEAEAMAV
jgi:hypothetical protein